MPKTEVRSGQILNATVGRFDLNTNTPGEAVVAKITAGANITISSTGADIGTGDVTISSTGGGGGGVEEVFIGPDDPGTPYELWFDTDEPSATLDDYVRGPASAVDSNLAAFDLTTGKLIKDSGIATTNVALTHVNNNFTAEQTISAVDPSLIINDTTAPANGKQWRIWNIGNELRFESRNDDGTFISRPLVLTRSGDVGVNGNLTVFDNDGNVACKDQSNVFTQNQQITRVTPRLKLIDTDQSADARQFQIYNWSQRLTFVAINDAESAEQGTVHITRTGDLLVSRDIYEKGRITPMGHWIDFTPTLLASSGSVTINTLYTAAYTLIGKTMTLAFYAQLSISGSPLYFTTTVPSGAVPARFGSGAFMDGATYPGMIQVVGGDTRLFFYRDGIGATVFPDGMSIFNGTITFSIQ